MLGRRVTGDPAELSVASPEVFIRAASPESTEYSEVEEMVPERSRWWEEVLLVSPGFLTVGELGAYGWPASAER
jgi:hypothetical protein